MFDTPGWVQRVRQEILLEHPNARPVDVVIPISTRFDPEKDTDDHDPDQKNIMGLSPLENAHVRIAAMTVTAQVVAWSRRCRHVVAWSSSPR